VNVDALGKSYHRTRSFDSNGHERLASRGTPGGNLTHHGASKMKKRTPTETASAKWPETINHHQWR
jgi:hypothetical protein